MGIQIIFNSVNLGYILFDENKIIEFLDKKEMVVNMINKYGFDFKVKDIGFHQ